MIKSDCNQIESIEMQQILEEYQLTEHLVSEIMRSKISKNMWGYFTIKNTQLNCLFD